MDVVVAVVGVAADVTIAMAYMAKQAIRRGSGRRRRRRTPDR
jgi:hypothetical protein